MKRLLTVLCMTLIVLVGAHAVFADLVPVGDPIEGNSWSQQFCEDAGQYDMICLKMISEGDSFEHSGARAALSAFDNAGWGLLFENDSTYPTVASASGPLAGDCPAGILHFTILFEDPNPKSNHFTFEFASYKAGVLNNAATCSWAGGWGITNHGGSPPESFSLTQCECIPVPGAVLIGLLGLGTAGVKLRKFA